MSSLTPNGPREIVSRATAGLLDDHRLVVSIGEAASLLGVSRSFAYELVRRGELRVVRLGRRQVVPKHALLELVGIRPDERTSVNEVST
jgi:excisionase family DNA binding protein